MEKDTIKPIPMGKSTIDYLRMEPAKNGFIISYNERVKEEKKGGTYDNCCYYDRKEVFDVDDTDDDSIDKAFNRFKELAMRQYNEMKE